MQGCRDAGVHGCRVDAGSHGRDSGKSNSIWECYPVDSLASPGKLSLVLELQKERVGIYASAHWAPRGDALQSVISSTAHHSTRGQGPVP